MKEIEVRKTLDSYIKTIGEQIEEFPEIRKGYLDACSQLKTVFGDAQKLIDLYEELTLISLEFYYTLGVEENAFHFSDPDYLMFPDRDYDDSKTEKNMRKTDRYSAVTAQIRKIRNSMTLEADRIFDKMREYHNFLDTYIPKMAHFKGYIWANSSLSQITPDYKEDEELTEKYRNWIEEYLGLKL